MIKKVLSILICLLLAMSFCTAAFAEDDYTSIPDISSDAVKADVVFVIDSTASMSDEINNVINNINGFSSYLESLKVDLRMAVIEYKDITVAGEEDSTFVHLLNYSPWHYTAQQIADTLSTISVDGGGDTAETLLDAMGCLLSDDEMLFRSDANKFAIVLTDANYKSNNNYGYTDMDEVINNLLSKGIYTSVISSTSYESYYSALYSKTGGIFANIRSDFAEILKSFADNIFGISSKERKAIYILPGYLGSKLYDKSGKEIWLNNDALKDDIIAHTLPGFEDSVILRNSDGTGGEVDVDITKDEYGTQDSYKELVNTLHEQFDDEYDVVFFPYNWVGDLNESANLLKQHITANGYDKVIFVTHSTGGLLASTFIAQSRENKLLVEKAILIAAPLYGTYSALIPIETGEYQNLVNDAIDQMLTGVLAVVRPVGKLAGHNWVKDVTTNSPTTYQLLPSEEYLKLTAAWYDTPYDASTSVTNAEEYYSILNGSKNINSNLTNGNKRSHKYFRDTILDGDIVSVLQEVDTLLILSNSNNSSDHLTPTIAVYESKLFGGTKLKEILYSKNGDGTVLEESAAALNINGNNVLEIKNFPNVDHSSLPNNKEVLSYLCNAIRGINGVSFFANEPYSIISSETDSGMSSLIKASITSDKEYNITVYDEYDNIIAIDSDTEYYGWDKIPFTYDVMSEEDGDYSAQLYMPNSGYRVVFSHGLEAGIDINAGLSISSLDNDGFKNATVSCFSLMTGEQGELFTLDTRFQTATPDNLNNIVDKEIETATEYDTNWEIPKTLAINNIGETVKMPFTSSSVLPEDLTWYSSDESVVSVSPDGTVIATGYGRATIVAHQNGSLKSMNCNVTVRLNAESVQFDNLQMVVGEKIKIKPVFNSEKVTETEVNYSISDGGIISIDEHGVITALSPGSVTVTGMVSGGAMNTFTVNVLNSSINAVKSVSLNKDDINIQIGEEATVDAIIEPFDADNQAVKWFIDDESVVSIEANNKMCKLKGISEGTAELTVVTYDGGYTASCKITVGATKVVPVESLTLSPESVNVNVGNSIDVTAIISPSDATNTNITWSVENDTIARIQTDNNICTVFGVSEGVTNVIAASEDGAYIAACRVTVTANNQSNLPIHNHEFTIWQFDNTYHWIGCVGCGIRTDVSYHTFVNGRCSVCGYINNNDDVEYVPEDEPIEIDVPTEGKYIEDEEENIIG